MGASHRNGKEFPLTNEIILQAWANKRFGIPEWRKKIQVAIKTASWETTHATYLTQDTHVATATPLSPANETLLRAQLSLRREKEKEKK